MKIHCSIIGKKNQKQTKLIIDFYKRFFLFWVPVCESMIKHFMENILSLYTWISKSTSIYFDALRYFLKKVVVGDVGG